MIQEKASFDFFTLNEAVASVAHHRVKIPAKFVSVDYVIAQDHGVELFRSVFGIRVLIRRGIEKEEEPMSKKRQRIIGEWLWVLSTHGRGRQGPISVVVQNVDLQDRALVNAVAGVVEVWLNAETKEV